MNVKKLFVSQSDVNLFQDMEITANELRNVLNRVITKRKFNQL